MFYRLRWFFLVSLTLLCSQIEAQTTQSIGDIAANITSTFESVAKLITASAYLTGAGMFFISIFQFRQHKENPTQVPLSKPMMFLALGCALLFFPTFVNMTEHTIFGDSAITAGPHGVLVGI
jgi:intracellular multiplication protein IcmD